MTATISAKEDTVLVDTDNGEITGVTRIFYDGDRRRARVFQRQLGDPIWKGPLNLQQKALDEGKTADATVSGDFISDPLSPGDTIQYGILPSGTDLDDLNPAEKEVSDGRFAQIVTVFALLKRSGEPDFISDHKTRTGGTWRLHQIATGTTETVMVLQAGQGVPFQDKFGMWQLSDVERTAISSKDTNHELEVTPLWPGHLYASTIRLSNKKGHWQSFHELFVTLRRTVDVTFSKLKIINDGDPFAEGEASFTFQVIEGKLGVVKTMTRPERDIRDENPFDEITLAPASSFSHTIGPKSITEDNRSIGVRISGHEYDGFLEPDEFAGNGLKLLQVPTGMGKETITTDTSVSAPSTSDDDFTFSVIVKHSIKYTS
jgi:hypothetical protein